MERPSSNYKKNFPLVGLFLLGLMTGCVDIQIKITFQNPDQGTVTLTYVFGYDLMGMTGPGGLGFLVPLPTTRAEAQTLVTEINGLQLVESNFTEGPEGRICTVTYRFLNARALQGLVTHCRQTLTWTQTGGQSQWSWAWNQAEWNTMNPKTKTLAQGVFGKKQVSWDLQFPRNLISASLGTISPDRRRLTLVQTWDQISKNPQALQVLW